MLENREYFFWEGENATVLEDVPDYIITESGRVWNRSEKKFAQRILNAGWSPACIKERGYYEVWIFCPDGSFHKTKLIHQLVAKHFIPNPQGLANVEPIDGERENHHATNLKWVENDNSSPTDFAYQCHVNPF